MSYIQENINEVRDNIYNICKKMNRNPEDIKIIAVTKTVDIDRISTAIDFGIDAIGENRVQEIRKKYNKIDKKVEWHMIGHLQTNKVKYIIDKVSLIHSLDSLRLAKEIDKRAKNIDKTMNVLVQINIGNEDSKYGIDLDDVHNFIEKLESFKNLKVQGLMAIAPYVKNPEAIRPHFKKMKKIFDDLKGKDIENLEMKYLSMGMTNDYLVAIEEGANIVRIGTGIFGKRNYNK
jgi:hypothetical protein